MSGMKKKIFGLLIALGLAVPAFASVAVALPAACAFPSYTFVTSFVVSVTYCVISAFVIINDPGVLVTA